MPRMLKHSAATYKGLWRTAMVGGFAQVWYSKQRLGAERQHSLLVFMNKPHLQYDSSLGETAVQVCCWQSHVSHKATAAGVPAVCLHSDKRVHRVRRCEGGAALC